MFMKRRWVGNCVNLSALAESIVRFFEENLFGVSCIKSENYRIVVRPKQFHGIVDKIEILVEGQPNDFSVTFDAGFRSRAFVKYGAFLSFFGGGFFLLKGLKSQEELEKLERKFWLFVSEEISRLTNSAFWVR
jgi:hypothetical protein